MSNFMEIRPAGAAPINANGHEEANTFASRLCEHA